MAPVEGGWSPVPLKIENVRQYAESQLVLSEWICLDELWQRESSWQTCKTPWLSENKTSGAYGIPQALPAEKMETVASDWKINAKTQIDWGLLYIKNRYTTPCLALKHHLKKGWY